MDGLLDREEEPAATAQAIEGASVVQQPKPLDTIRGSDDDVDSATPKPNPRKSRSFENLLDTAHHQSDADGASPFNADDRSQSVDCLMDENENPSPRQDNAGSPSQTPSTNAIFELNSNSSQDVVYTSPKTPTSTSTTDSADSRPSYSRQDSSTSSKDSEHKRTFLNRYVRKVKSFIKK